MSCRRGRNHTFRYAFGRYLTARLLVGAATAGMLLLPAAGGATFVAPGVAATVALSGLAAAAARRRGVERQRLVLAFLLGLDLVVEGCVVAATGVERSPFALLFSLTIAASGLFFGLQGGLLAAIASVTGYWGLIAATGQTIEIGPVFTGFFLAALGFLFGRLGRNVAVQSIEMDRVRDELERVRLDAETIVASLGGPLLCLDRAGRIRRINHAAAKLLGLGVDLPGLRLAEAGSGGRIAPLLRFVEAAFEGGPCSIELQLPGKSGARATPIEISASPVRDRDGGVQGLVLLLSDLTRRKEQEAEQARKERLAVVGELSGHLAHEIRNSLKPLVGSVELLVKDLRREGVEEELVAIILRESEALETFLSDFLTYARDKSLTVEPFDLDELIDELTAAMRRHPACGCQVTLTRIPDRPGGWIRADRTAVRDILRNLVINALEATPEGRVEISSAVDGKDVEVIVEDTGTGLPPGETEELFEPFCTHKAGGTGLGLSIARRLARRMNGEVSLEPKEGRGVRAHLMLKGSRARRHAA